MHQNPFPSLSKKISDRLLSIITRREEKKLINKNKILSGHNVKSGLY